MTKEMPNSKEGSNRYVAFLRGINVGGHKVIPMEELRTLFESMGFKNVKTLLASGNVVFDAKKAQPYSMGEEIGQSLENRFGYRVGIIVRSINDIQKLVTANPFKKIAVTPATRLYVTFLPTKQKRTLKKIQLSAGRGIDVLSVSAGEVCTAVIVVPGEGTPQLMGFLEKEFGKEITTRNWNTICKVAEA